MSPTIIAVLVAIVLQGLTLGWGFVQSSRADSYKEKLQSCNATHAALVLQTEAVGRIAAAKVKETEENNRRIADETAKGWASALDVVRADAARRMRQSAAASAGGRELPGSSPPAAGIDAAAEGALPTAERIVADCAEDALKLSWLQHWIVETMEASK